MDRNGEAYDSTYVFSSEQQEEVKKLYQKYLPQQKDRTAPSEEDEKMERLRRLDRSVTRSGTTAGLLTGACGAGIHAAGITLIQGETMFTLGTVIAVAGIVLFLAAYPVYSLVSKKQHRKVEAQILKLCEELMK